MAKNDMEVIMYKILRYLYECMKTGKTPDLADIMWNCKMFDIPKAYWLAIMQELIEDEYIGGLRFVGAKDMEQVLQVGNIKITKKGRDFLKDESVLSKIKPVLGTGFEALVTAVASTIMP
ncbi:YjcQ family protein [Ruminococcus callidus]|uniref:YjcQ family protein n=1 Tax=Ruminococcus callidus TaxID=40519 RepID=UPI00267594BF|nr:YjcQ family protein [uncultured Ruminococcus sp.]